MRQGQFQKYYHDGLTGEVSCDPVDAFDEGRIKGLWEEVFSQKEGLLAEGRNRVVVLCFEREGCLVQVAVKAFGRQGGWKDRYDREQGSKAARSFQAPCFLQKHGVGTPEPLVYFDRWENGGLAESYYFSEYLSGLRRLKAELSAIYSECGPADLLAGLLEKFGTTMK